MNTDQIQFEVAVHYSEGTFITTVFASDDMIARTRAVNIFMNSEGKPYTDINFCEVYLKEGQEEHRTHSKRPSTSNLDKLVR